MSREVVPFHHDVFLRSATHFERRERLAAGHHYKVGMLLNRDEDGLLSPYQAGDSDRGLFIAVSEQDRTEASDVLLTPVVASGQFWSDLLLLPEGVTLATAIDGFLLIDLLRMNGLLAVDRDDTYYTATEIFNQGEA